MQNESIDRTLDFRFFLRPLDSFLGAKNIYTGYAYGHILTSESNLWNMYIWDAKFVIPSL